MVYLIIEAYSPTGDILTIILSVLCWIFLLSTYAERQKNLAIIHVTSLFMTVAAIGNITFHSLLATNPNNVILFVLEAVVYILMVATFMGFAAYLNNLFNLTDKQQKIVYWMGAIPFIGYCILKITQSIMIYPNYELGPQWGFLVIYIYYCVCLIGLIQIFKYKIAPKLIRCLQQSFLLSLILTIGQSLIPSTTFLTISFMFPILAAMFLFHYNPYDLYTGALDKKALSTYLHEKKNKNMGIYGLQLKDFIFDRNPVTLLFLQNVENLFKGYQVFRVYEDTLFLVFDKKSNLNKKILDNMVPHRVKTLYRNFKIPFKITYMDYTGDDVNYIALHEEICKEMQWNTFYKN